ncbi:MAG: LON peptidase substrate-binding domain-containing protein [Planctomycetota bacterium]|nr:LON peptidase substrate-binding domain-containing protein [Planctomycetota bacterium]
MTDQRLDIDAIVAAFPKRVPVFPLPDTLLFPGAVLPLHIFEPRYRQMVQDALDSDRLIAMALLGECTPEEYERKPPFSARVCVGSLLHVESLPKGRSNILLAGVVPGDAVEQFDDKPYRCACVEPAPDVIDPGYDYDAALQELMPLLGSLPFTDMEHIRDEVAKLVGPDGVAPALINTCAQRAPLPGPEKLELLMERDLTARLHRLLELVDKPWRWN